MLLNLCIKRSTPHLALLHVVRLERVSRDEVPAGVRAHLGELEAGVDARVGPPAVFYCVL